MVWPPRHSLYRRREMERLPLEEKGGTAASPFALQKKGDGMAILFLHSL